MAKKKLSIKTMKLISIKNECFAIAGVANLDGLKCKYVTLCKGRDFRKRNSWEYILKRLQTDGEWMGVKVADIELRALKGQKHSSILTPQIVTFSPECVEWDKASENDD